MWRHTLRSTCLDRCRSAAAVDRAAAPGQRRRRTSTWPPDGTHPVVLLAPAENRLDPVALQEEQSASRAPEPIRYGRMLVSPFTFIGARC
jgi:hypothetical protein